MADLHLQRHWKYSIDNERLELQLDINVERTRYYDQNLDYIASYLNKFNFDSSSESFVASTNKYFNLYDTFETTNDHTYFSSYGIKRLSKCSIFSK